MRIKESKKLIAAAADLLTPWLTVDSALNLVNRALTVDTKGDEEALKNELFEKIDSLHPVVPLINSQAILQKRRSCAQLTFVSLI